MAELLVKEMSKRTLIFVALGAFLLPLLVVGAMAVIFPDQGFFRPRSYSEEIPSSRPSNPDRRLLKRFSGKTMEEIIAALRAEEKEKGKPSGGSSGLSRYGEPPAILAMLPDAPLPFPKDAVPVDLEGLKAFVANLKSGQEPGNLTAEEQWQFNLALAALGVKPEDVPATIRQETRLLPENDTFPVQLHLVDTSLRGPVAVGGMAANGHAEISTGGGNGLYTVESESGDLIASDALERNEPGDAVQWVDFDGDGHPDLWVTRGGGLPDSLLRNSGDGRFTDETGDRGLLAFGDSTASAWMDYDGDGRLDLVVGYSNRPLELYRQTEEGRFEPAAWETGLWVPNGVRVLVVADWDGDGFEDLFVGREQGGGRIYFSRSDENPSERRFERAEVELGWGQEIAISAAQRIDCDNDGRVDLLLATDANTSGQGSLRLYRNEGEGRFTDSTEMAGLRCEDVVLSLGVADLDWDGYADVLVGTPALVPDRIFDNQTGAGFEEVTVAAEGGYLSETVAWACGDLRGDGKMHLFATESSGRVRHLIVDGLAGHWLHVTMPASAADARVVATVRDPDWIVHTYHISSGRAPSLTLGLGSGQAVESLEIYAGAHPKALVMLENLGADQKVDAKSKEEPKEGATAENSESTAKNADVAP